MTTSLGSSSSSVSSSEYPKNIDDIGATLQASDPADVLLAISENKSKRVRPEDTAEAKARFAFLQSCKPFADKPGYSYRIGTIVQPILTGVFVISSITLGVAAAFDNKPTPNISFGIQVTALYTAAATVCAMFGHAYYYSAKIPPEQQKQEGWNLFQGPHRFPKEKIFKKLTTLAMHEV